MSSADRDFVSLAPTLPAGEDRVLRVHQGILCDASCYFASLLESDFAEASELRQGSQLGDPPSSPQAQLGTPAKAVLKQEGPTRPAATVKVNDITYSQLQTLLFFIFTGEAVFQRRPCTYETSTETPDKGISAGSDSYACPSYWETRERSTASLIESKLPWWDGHLEPANAFDMFRIADKYCIEGLRSAALQHIARDISASTIKSDLEGREEIALFPEIKDVYRNFCTICLWALGSDVDKLMEEILGLDIAKLSED
ncbi:uncharacterized protein SRS1_10623 [Sporisorium reilianum f. sp. reilianum]|uniref:BTB domain-containing protein n=1 Tax=Sporisorium reilianum f. sp. reilianum TaxID=72559 RepID=A0A2N8UB27_9BASI|nr:uncharacterized protein SRS1_10623 [Sporisorium reilianum f. sp. reilianum]